MKWLILTILITSQILPQTWLEKSEKDLQELTALKEEGQKREYFTKAKIGLYASSVAYSISGGLVDGWNWRRHQNIDAELKDDYNKLWHRVKPIRDISAFSIGATITLDANAFKAFDSWNDFRNTAIVGASDLVLVSAISWILFDHFNYVGMGADVPFLGSSDWAKQGNNGIWSDVIASPFTKIAYLIFAIIQNYFLTINFG